MSAPPAAPQAAERTRRYTPYKGARDERRAKWWVVAKGNLSLAWSNRWVKLLLFLSLVPGIIAGGIVYFVAPLSTPILLQLLRTSVFFVFLVGALVGARLVSEDRRQGAFIAHFSRPVRRADYLAGKVVALALPLFVVAAAPSTLAVLADMSVENETLADRIRAQTGGLAGGLIPGTDYLVHVEPPLALRIIAAFGLLAALTTTGIVLGLSALTTRARTAGVAWFAVVALGGAAAGILGEATGDAWPALLSWSDAMGDIAGFLNGQTTSDLEYGIFPRTVLLAALSAAGLAFVDWRLRRAEGGERS